MTMATCLPTVHAPYLTKEEIRTRRLACAKWMREMLERVAAHYGLSLTEILEKDRHKHTVDARHVAMWIARQHKWSFPEIARQMERDHSTVIHAVRRVMETPHLWAIARELDTEPTAVERVAGEGAWVSCG